MTRTAVTLAALMLGGCATTQYVPVPTERRIPQPPAECYQLDNGFPRVPKPVNGVVPPEVSAKWALSARQWSQVMSNRRAVCRRYAEQMRRWK